MSEKYSPTSSADSIGFFSVLTFLESCCNLELGVPGASLVFFGSNVVGFNGLFSSFLLRDMFIVCQSL